MSEGFAAIPNWMIRDKTVSGPAIAVYCALASHSGKGGIHPSQVTLAEEARLGQRRTRDALVELEQLGVVERVRRSTQGGRASDAYLLHPNGPDQQPAPDAGSGPQPAPADAATGTTQHDVPLIEEEPIKKSPSEYFEEFWAAYPRHVAKAAAKAKFEQLGKKRGIDLADVVEGARRYSKSPDLPEPKFIPHPMTWLNQGRWEDEIPTVPESVLTSSADDEEAAREAWLAARGITLEEYVANHQTPGWLEQLERAYRRRLDDA